MLPLTLQFLVAMIASAINERMQRKLDYAQAEVAVLTELLKSATGVSRLAFTPDQRRRLALKGKLLSPAERQACCQIVAPETILAWFRLLAARKFDSSKAKCGRPREAKDVRALVLKMARENINWINWGYTKIRDALRTGLKIEIARSTVASILADEGVEPAPERGRKRTWKHFLKIHKDSLYACDFFSVEVLGVFGAVRHLVFFFIDIKTRAVHVGGIAVDPGAQWVNQSARNVTAPLSGFLRNARYLIHDRDPLFTSAGISTLRAAGVKSVKVPASSPNCNPHAERFVRTIRNECLDHFVFFGVRHLRHVVSEFVAHYNTERFHQGLGGRLITPCDSAANDNAQTVAVKRASRLGGLLNFYHRKAA